MPGNVAMKQLGCIKENRKYVFNGGVSIAHRCFYVSCFEPFYFGDILLYLRAGILLATTGKIKPMADF